MNVAVLQQIDSLTQNFNNVMRGRSASVSTSKCVMRGNKKKYLSFLKSSFYGAIKSFNR